MKESKAKKKRNGEKNLTYLSVFRLRRNGFRF